MGESLIQRRRVRDEALRGVNLCCEGRIRSGGNARSMTVPHEKAPANYVPAAAVIRRGRALPGFTGRKGGAGDPVCRV